MRSPEELINKWAFEPKCSPSQKSKANLTENTNHTLLLCCFKDNGVVPSSAGTRHPIGCRECVIIRAAHAPCTHTSTRACGHTSKSGWSVQRPRREARGEKDDNMQPDSERAKSWEQSNASLRVQTPSEQGVHASCLTIDVGGINHEQTAVCAENAS